MRFASTLRGYRCCQEWAKYCVEMLCRRLRRAFRSRPSRPGKLFPTLRKPVVCAECTAPSAGQKRNQVLRNARHVANRCPMRSSVDQVCSRGAPWWACHRREQARRPFQSLIPTTCRRSSSSQRARRPLSLVRACLPRLRTRSWAEFFLPNSPNTAPLRQMRGLPRAVWTGRFLVPVPRGAQAQPKDLVKCRTSLEPHSFRNPLLDPAKPIVSEQNASTPTRCLSTATNSLVSASCCRLFVHAKSKCATTLKNAAEKQFPT